MGTAKATKKKLKTSLTTEQMHQLHYYMVLNRVLDDKVTSLYKRGELLGAAFGSMGQEAIGVGTVYALEPNDVIGPMIRNSGSILVKGLPPAKFLANYLARVTGPTHGRDGNTHLGDLSRGIVAPVSMLGVMIPVLAGVAESFKIRNEKRVAMTWCGDGASSAGDFHEGLNYAAVRQLPLVVILENNLYAYSTPIEKQTRITDFADKAEGYGIPGVIVDGNDVIAVYEITKQAVDRARNGGGPTLIEAKTFRRKGHAEHDDAFYVPQEVKDYWAKRDPIDLYEKFLQEEGMLDDPARQAVWDKAQGIIDAAEEEALEAPHPDPEDPNARGVYAD